ncbi:MAG: peroxide stress protein YaaA [Microbacteriaceae bacterium]|nr:peroxide stress protein YaaA [Microbacteriaceae bacterium]
MLLLLPPSETKRHGGVDGTALDLSLLSHPSLTGQRRVVLSATRKLSRNLAAMSAALRLGPGQRDELIRNRELRSSATLPAIERYTGVLYDALDAPTLSVDAREFARHSIQIHSAMFGLVGADDPIPAYRLSHNSRLPDVSLRRTWQPPISAILGARDGLILDLRSEAYVELGPVPHGDSFFLRVVAEGPDGRKRALNHFNKKGKGLFSRAVASAGIEHSTVESLLDWAAASGIRLEPGEPGELLLTV